MIARILRWFLFPLVALKKEVCFPAVTVHHVPNITRVVIDEDRLWDLVGLKFKKKPNLILALGPIDGITGMMIPANGDVVIDVGELVMSPLGMLGSDRDLDRAITETVAHEARHRYQLQHWGKFGMIWDKLLMVILRNLLFFAIVHLVVRTILDFVNFSFPVMFGIMALLYVFTVHYFKFTGLRIYLWCRSERDARQYARQAVQDPRWEEVVKVIREQVFEGFPGMVRIVPRGGR